MGCIVFTSVLVFRFMENKATYVLKYNPTTCSRLEGGGLDLQSRLQVHLIQAGLLVPSFDWDRLTSLHKTAHFPPSEIASTLREISRCHENVQAHKGLGHFVKLYFSKCTGYLQKRLFIEAQGLYWFKLENL
jgi:hypothetical protein